MKNKATLTLKLASVLVVLAMLLSVFAVSATDVNGYYKTIASIDYEEVNTNIPKKENVTITTLANGSTGYLYANPSEIKNITIVPIQGLQQDAQYTYMVDFYVLEYSNDANGIFARLDLANMDGQLIETYLNKNAYRLNEWNTYSKQITYNTTNDSWISIFSFADAKIIFDNVRIVDSNGNVVFCEDFETEDLTLVDGFSYIHDYSGSSVDADDKVLHLTNGTTGNVNGTVGEFALGVESTTTTYTLTYDYLIKHKSTNESIDFVFRYSSYCAECKGDASFGHKPYGDRDHYIGSGKEVNKWYSDTLTFSFDDKCDNTYAEIHLFPNADVIFDNIVVKDSDGNVVKEFNMNSGTITGGIGRGNFGGNVDFAVKNELIWLNGTPDVTDGHLYVNASELNAENKQVRVDFEIAEDVAATEYPYVNLKYRLLEGTTLTSGNMFAISLNGNYSGNAIQWFSIPADYTPGEWLTITDRHFGNATFTAGDAYINIHVYSGVEIEFDDIEIHRNENSGGATLANIDFASNGTFVEESDTAVVEEIKDYGVLIDNSSETAADGYLSFHFHQLGITDYPYAPAGSYTVQFDFYALEEGNYRFIYSSNDSGWNGETSKVWSSESKEIAQGEWKTVSINVNASGEICYQKLHIYGGIKGYLDNFKLISSDGRVLTDYQFTADKLGGQYTDGTDSATIVEMPSDVVAAKKDYAILADNTAATSATDYLSFFIHELGYNMHAKAPAGAYTVQFDFYALEEGNYRFIYSSNDIGWNGETSKVWSSESKEIAQGEWKTVSININATGEIGYQKLHLYGGIKGYLDNFKLISSDGTVHTNYRMTSKDLGKSCADGKVSIVALSDEIAAAKNPPVVTGDNYDVKYVVDSVGLKTYGSNGVLKVNPSENMYYDINNANFGVNFVTGNKYRLSFDYMVTVPSEQNFYFAVTNINGNGNHDFINYEDELTDSVSYEFIYTGSLSFVIYGGGEVIFDNFLIEEFVNYPTLGVQKRGSEDGTTVSALAYGMQLKVVDGAEYIYDINENAIEVAEKGFIAVLSDRVEGELTLDVADSNPYVSTVKVTNPAETIVFAGATHNVYTLAITAPELDRSITVRPYVLDAEGNVYYGEATISSANDLADMDFDSWIGAAVN